MLDQTAQRIDYLRRALKIAWTAAQGWVLAWAVILIIQGVVPGVTVYLTKLLVDAVAGIVDGGFSMERLDPVLLPAGLMGAALLLMESTKGLKQWIQTAQAEHIRDHVRGLIHAKAMEVDLGFYETPQYYDLLERARRESLDRPLQLLQSLGGLIQNGITILTVGAILIPYGAWLPVVLVGSTLPALYVVIRYNRREHEWTKDHTADERRATYYDFLLTVDKAAPEVRLFGLGERYHSLYQAVRKRLREGRLEIMRQRSLAQFIASLSGLTIMAVVMAWMVWRSMQGFATLGDLALFYRAFEQGQGLMRSLLKGAGQIYTHSLYLEHLFDLLQLEPSVTSPSNPKPVPTRIQEGIEFENVSFQYPYTDRYALRGLSLHIPAGSVVAIVGPNGAGKSSLMKLLCRFYDPDEGRIQIDGIDLRQIDLDELRSLMTVMFQDPFHYQAPVTENIAMADQPDEMRMRAAAEGAGAHTVVQNLPSKYKTLLGKWFEGGTELSGGEWQRVTLARAFYREAPLMILDEPTSKLDSWSENEWYDRFLRYAEGRTVLLITHRFTTAMRADHIVVMEDGHVVEQGTHSELLAQSGRYAESWYAQMQQKKGTSKSVL